MSSASLHQRAEARVAQLSDRAFVAYAIAAAFTTYLCMYAIRKPFTVGDFSGSMSILGLPEVDTKILMIISQVLGYCLSKFIGIKIISEMPSSRRTLALIGFLGLAWLSLLLFALAPPPLRLLCLFINGLPLGMIWGLVFGYLEGRRFSEVLGAGLSASYIVASGFVKTAGRWVMDFGVPDAWMPFVTGAVFLPPMAIAIWMLSTLPPPSEEDKQARTERAPMDAEARRRFFTRYAPGLILLTILYVVLTAYRDFRDNFAPEIWSALGYADQPSIMTTSELPITFGVLLVLAGIMWVRDNQRAVLVVHGIMTAGSLLILVSTLLYQQGLLEPAPWMILVGLGLYIGYVPYGCVLFDRLIAAGSAVGTAGFLIYVTDAFGYLGSVGLLLYKNFGQPDLSWLDFFLGFSYVTGALCSACLVLSWLYFTRTLSRED